MKILRLRLENLNSLRLRQNIDFAETPLSETGLFAITGDTGAGKTTILDAITLALYGRIHRNKEVTEVMSYGATQSLAEVEFSSAKGLFRAKWSTYRSRGKPDGNMQPPRRELAQWDEQKKDFRIIAEKIREVDSMVEEVTGLDYDRFTRSVLLSQGDFAAFLQAGERERSELLERITGTEIYTRLSIAAYERAKSEQQQLEALHRQQQGLQLLSKEETEAIHADLQEHRQRADQIQEELRTLREQIQWYQQKSELEIQQAAIREQEAEWQHKQEAFLPDEQRLESHLRAQPYQPLLERNAEDSAQLDLLSRELQELQTEEQYLQTELNQLNDQLKTAQTDLQELQQLKKRHFPILDQVLTLDKDLEIKKTELNDLAEEERSLGEEIRLIKDQRMTRAKRLDQAQQEQQELDQWLEEQSHRAQLGILLPVVDRKLEDMRQLTQEQKQCETKKNKLLQEQVLLEKQFADLSEKAVLATRQVEHWSAEFQKDLPPGYALGRNDLLRALHQDIEELGEQQKQLVQLRQFTTEYHDLLLELSEYEAQIESLNAQETALDKQVICTLDALDWTREQLVYKQEIFEQQQLIANYEKDRHRLSEGAPCPLCQSTHHPFREHPVTPFADRARAEFEKCKKAYEKLQSENNRLLNQQKEIKVRKEQLMGTELQELGGQMARQFHRIEQLEERLANMILRLEPEKYEQDRGPALEAKIQAAEAYIAQKKGARDRLIEISKHLDQQEQILQQLETERRDSQSRLHLLTQRLKDCEDQLADIQQRYAALLEEVKQVFVQFGQEFSPDKANDRYQSLKKDYELFVQKTERQRQLRQEIALGQQEVAQQQQLEEKEHMRLQKLVARLDRIRSLYDSSRQKRLELLGEADPLAEKERLEKELEQKIELVNGHKEQVQDLTLQLQGLRPLQRSKEKERQLLEQQLASRLEHLDEAALQIGFPDRMALAESLLQLEEADSLLGLKTSLEREQLALRQSLQDLETQMQKLVKARTVETPLEDLLGHLDRREQDYLQFQQTIGGLTERLSANQKQLQTAGKLVKQIATQEKEFTRWAQLNEIIGQADGKKFRIFAQGLTLSKLIELANYHLESLHGRYFIRKRSDENLELEIIDTFQADNARSMNTLSGGEGFLVSLALALGLSDLAGRDARIQSLFIDEGFGTLDENSLDMAIDTLENLQSNGKMIGIISHVKALKERIGTQIQVTKKGTGFSEIAIVG